VHSLVKPKYFVPIHGEYRHMVLHARIAESLDLGTESFILTDGDVLELTERGAEYGEPIPADYVYVDGLGVGDIDHVVLRDRKHLASDGMVVVILAVDKQTGRVTRRPDVVSRGFVDMDESEELIERTRDEVLRALEGAEHIVEWGAVNTQVKESVAKFLYDETRRRPMVLPVAVEV
jgi:ribonuclease J